MHRWGRGVQAADEMMQGWHAQAETGLYPQSGGGRCGAWEGMARSETTEWPPAWPLLSLRVRSLLLACCSPCRAPAWMLTAPAP